MPSLPRQQPFHEPVGLSPEVHGVSRRWLVTLIVAVAALVAGAVAIYRLTA